jgi:hypothetical protein
VKTAFIYIATSISLAILFYLTRKIVDDSSLEDDVFRYPRSATVVLAIGLVILAGVLVALGFLMGNLRSLRDAVLYSLIACLVLASYGYLLWYVRSFRISFRDGIVSYGGAIKTRSFKLDEILRIVILEGGSGERVLLLYDVSNRELMKVTSQIRDFDYLVSKFRRLAHDKGVSVATRNRWGQWTK